MKPLRKNKNGGKRRVEIEGWADRTKSGEFGKWIPADARLPVTNERVLVNIETSGGWRHVEIGYYNNQSEWSKTLSGKVVGWMPLPDPYAEESKKEDEIITSAIKRFTEKRIESMNKCLSGEADLNIHDFVNDKIENKTE